MTRYTLADASHLHSVNVARARVDQAFNKVPQPTTPCCPSTKIMQANGNATVRGIFNEDGLVVSLCSPDYRCTFREQICVRFSPQELPKIGDVPDHTNRFCDVSPGETSEGLQVVIESHRCYAADSEGNASTLKARSNIHYLTFR